MSCNDITNTASNIRQRPSLFSKKGSYIKVQRVFDRCDAGWYILEDGRKKDISVVISPTATDMYDANALYVPRYYNGHEIVEFGDSTPATNIIDKVLYDESKLRLVPLTSTSIQVDFTSAALPPDIGDIVGPVASTTFAPGLGEIDIRKRVTNNVVSTIWEQEDANEYI